VLLPSSVYINGKKPEWFSQLSITPLSISYILGVNIMIIKVYHTS